MTDAYTVLLVVMGCLAGLGVITVILVLLLIIDKGKKDGSID